MNKLYTFLVIVILAIAGTSNAQAPSLKAYEKAAQKALDNKDFFSAWKYYTITVEIDSQRMDNMYNLAEAARLFKSYEVAEDAYQKVLASEEKTKYPAAEYWLAATMRSQENYNGAIKHFRSFLDNQMTPRGEVDSMMQHYSTMATEAIQYCTWAKDKMQTPKGGFKIQKFGTGVNTAGTEFAPVQVGNQVYYSALEYDAENFCPKPNPDITRLYTMNNTGDKVGAINWANQQDGHFVAHTAFNGDGSRMYFTICKRINASEFDCSIYYRDKNQNSMWGTAKPLPDHINKAGTTNTQPNIGYDDNTGKELLFFVTDRVEEGEGRGDLNIYCSLIETDGTVTKPFKLDVNTPQDDITPFFHKEDNKLFFSSNGFKGFGGFDIYESQKTGSNFSDPVAMDYPLNSSYDDIYFSTDENFENAYFSSNRYGVEFETLGMETCCNDIFKLEIIKVDLIARTWNSINNSELDSCTVVLIDRETGEEVARKTNTKGHDFNFELELEKDYMVVATHEGRWTGDTTYVSTKEITEPTTIETDLYLTPDIDLIATTFEKETQAELLGCTFTLINLTTGDTLFVTERPDDNRFTSMLEFGMDYKIVATKPYYLPDEETFSTKEFSTPKTIKVPLYLELPVFATSVSLYFDNDEPDQDTWATTTNRTYEEAYIEYVKQMRMEEFVLENTKGLTGEEKIEAEQATREFFENRVKRGMKQLELFATLLEVYLPTGRVYEVNIEGFASPRAPSKYNKHLTSRRVSSVENYLRRFKGGVLDPYIGPNKNLRIKLIPRGEEPSAGLNIPSLAGDPRSIFSIMASEQRKVEIVELKRIDDQIR